MARRPTDLEVGYCGKAHGLRGEVNVKLVSDRLERVAPGSMLATEDADLVVRSSRPHQRGYIIAFEGVTSREGAEALRGAVLYGAPIDDPDVVWVHELIGAQLEDLDGLPRGTIVSVQENPASDLMVTDEGALVPLTFYVERRGEVVVIDPPPGLFEMSD